LRPHLLLAALFAATPLAHAAPGHVHGEGRLDVAIDKDSVTLNLELPLDAAVGFERAPKNDKEQAALAAVRQALDATPFAATPAAQCALQTKEVAVPFLVGQPPAAGEHADVEARYVFRCAAPAALKGIETSIFKSFKRLYRLETQRAGPSGQGAMRLTPNKPVLSW
jgi:hypothetical protein